MWVSYIIGENYKQMRYKIFKKAGALLIVGAFSLFAFAGTSSVTTLSATADTLLIHPDGPYIIHRDGVTKAIRVSEDGVWEEVVDKNAPFRVISHDGSHSFEVKLYEVTRPEWKYGQPDEVFIISDPHGNIEPFISILKRHKIIGDSYEWIFGSNHLVIVGDVFDRGDDVLPIFWLIYKLEEEARIAGGVVHFIPGNHEEMIMRSNLRYMEPKYVALAEELGIEYRELWSPDSELGNWIMTRNTIEVIGNDLFVHAGLSKEFLEYRWSIPQLNDSIRLYVYKPKEERDKTEVGKFLFGSNGPLWYRGMVRTDEQYNPIATVDVDAILKQYEVSRVIVGHTIFREVTLFHDGKVIGVNVDNQKNMDEGRTRGLLIKGDQIETVR